jgi:hypothetical protein
VDRDRFRGRSNDLALVAFDAGSDVRGDRYANALARLRELLDYFGEQIERARAEPGART